MSLVYKAAVVLVKASQFKRVFRMSKENILKFARKENKKNKFDLEKLKDKAREDNFYIVNKKIMGYDVIKFQLRENLSDKAVLYLYGGGMITGPDKKDFKLAKRIMENTKRDVWFLFYPLCIDNSINLCYDVCLECYKEMNSLYRAKNINVVGFSSGACLSIGTFLHNNMEKNPLNMPNKIIAVSPGVLPNLNNSRGLKMMDELKKLSKKDILIDAEYFKTAREICKRKENIPEYMLDGTVGDFSNFPKTYFYYGSNECIFASAKYFKDAYKKYDAKSEFIIGEGMCHCYPLMRFFKEGRESQDEIIKLLEN